nr:hypothetical protein [Dyella soli]
MTVLTTMHHPSHASRSATGARVPHTHFVIKTGARRSSRIDRLA